MSFTIENRAGNRFIVLIDDEDAERVLMHKWYVSLSKGQVSVRKEVGRKHILLHHFLLGIPLVGFIDHKNGNRLDNRKLNLRFATQSQNCANRISIPHTSIFKGVSWKDRNRKWQAQIKTKGKVIYIGLFTDEQEAAQAYDVEANRLFGEFAKLNFPPKEKVD